MKNKAVALLAASFLLAGCGTGSGSGSAKMQVVASFYPFQYVAEQVGGSLVTVENLTEPGVEPHDLELKPQQVADVQGAGLVIFEREFQAAVDNAVDQAGRPAGGTVDVARLVTLQPLQPGAAQNGEHGTHDPHVWLDPVNMIAVTKAVATKLSALDPRHASTYAANAAALTAKLQAVDSSFRTVLATCKTKTIVTSHAAFGYLAKRYGLTQIPIAGIDPSNEPSPAQLADITTLVRQEKISTIFTERLVSPAIADTVARETGAKTATLDPIEGLSDKTAHENYLTLMAENLARIAKADNCS